MRKRDFENAPGVDVEAGRFGSGEPVVAAPHPVAWSITVKTMASPVFAAIVANDVAALRLAIGAGESVDHFEEICRIVHRPND